MENVLLMTHLMPESEENHFLSKPVLIRFIGSKREMIKSVCVKNVWKVKKINDYKTLAEGSIPRTKK